MSQHGTAVVSIPGPRAKFDADGNMDRLIGTVRPKVAATSVTGRSESATTCDVGDAD